MPGKDDKSRLPLEGKGQWPFRPKPIAAIRIATSGGIEDGGDLVSEERRHGRIGALMSAPIGQQSDWPTAPSY